MPDSDDTYIDNFAPSYRILEAQIMQDEEDIRAQENILRRFKLREAEITDADFRII